MNRIYGIICLLLISVFLLQCRKELSFIGTPDPDVFSITPDPITATLQGNITDENNLPASGVAITAGSLTAITNAAGYFRINGASLDKNTSLITADKAGYFRGYRVFSATAGTNQVAIKLVKKMFAGSISASSGGNATLASGAVIRLPANGFVMAATGAAYAGEVKIYAAYIDPKAADISQTVPGSFGATDKNGKRVVLSSYGMLAVELESGSGEKLQVKTGAAATLTFPIPAAALASAPASIALWYVDEQNGLWKEEGAATRQGNNYVGEVSHFSYWNCDRPFNAVSLSLTLQNAKGLPMVHINTRVTVVDSSGAVAYGITDSLGKVKGLVPAGKTLLLEVLDPCGKSIYSKTLSPLTNETDLGTIVVSTSSSSILTITGKLLDCNSQPVKQGYAIINIDNVIRYAATDANGQYTSTLLVCQNSASTAQVVGIDPAARQQSAATITAITLPGTDAGNISVCGTYTLPYLEYTLDGVKHLFSVASNDSLYAYKYPNGTSDEINLVAAKGLDYISLVVKVARNTTATGTYPAYSLQTGDYNTTTLKQPFNVAFTNFAKSKGEFFEGTYSGQFTSDSSTKVHTINSSFKLQVIN